MLRKFTHCFHIPGALSSDPSIRFTAPSDCIIRHVSAVASNATDGTIALGISTATTAFLTAKAIGQSNTPNTYGRADFNGTAITCAGNEFPRIRAGDIVVVNVVRGGTAAQNLTVVVTFEEG